MNSGAKPTPIDHRDFDLHKSFGSIAPPQFPPDYLTDAGLWMPDQNEPEEHFMNPALPYGCTDYTQADLPNDETGTLVHNPIDLDTIDHANALGGIDIRTAIQAAQKLNWIGTYFNVRAIAPLDSFDAIRLAMLSGAPEKRSVSWGTPWYPSFDKDIEGIVSAPASYDPTGLSWHNSKIAGWKTINGQPYLINKSWQGADIGDKGFLYFPREVVNAIMGVSGTVAFTATQQVSPSIQTVSLSTLQTILSYLRQMMAYSY